MKPNNLILSYPRTMLGARLRNFGATRVDPNQLISGGLWGLHVWTPKLRNFAPHTCRPPKPPGRALWGSTRRVDPKVRNVVFTAPPTRTDVCRPQRAMPATVGAPTRVSTTQGFDYLNPPALRSSTQSIHNWHFEIRIRLARAVAGRAARPLPALGPAPPASALRHIIKAASCVMVTLPRQ